MATSVAYTNFSYHFHSETPLGKIIRLSLRLIPKGVPVRIRAGAAKGMQWITGAHVHGCWIGTYEKDKQDFCQVLIKPGMTAFDIGANAAILQDLQGDAVDPTDFVSDEFIAIPR